MPRQNIILEAFFEGSNPFGPPLTRENNQFCCSYSVTQSTEQFRSGSASMKVDLRKTDATVSGSKRAEIQETVGTPTEGIRWYGMSFFLPKPWLADGFGESLTQWHDSDNTTPPIALCVWDGHLWLRRNIKGSATNYDLGLITDYEGKWMDFVMSIKWSVGNTGFIQVWINKKQKLNVSNIVTNSNGCYWKIGMNKWIWQDNPSASKTTQRIFYIDEIREGNQLATYDDVAPGDAVSIPNQPPVVNAGVDVSVKLPASSIVLSGIASDVDGTIAAFKWEVISGNPVNIVSPTKASTEVNGLTAGQTLMRFSATDNNGATSTDDVVITVVAADPVPVPVVNKLSVVDGAGQVKFSGDIKGDVTIVLP